MDPEHIDVMLAEGISFDTIEQRVDATELPDSIKNMLWLYLWVQADPEDCRRCIAGMLEMELAALLR